MKWALRFSRSCDLKASGLGAEHAAETIAEVRIGSTTFHMGVCEADVPLLSLALVELGFQPSKTRVGHNRRGAYLTATGKKFTTKDARTWLQETGHEVAEVAEAGRLTGDQLQMYAAAH